MSRAGTDFYVFENKGLGFGVNGLLTFGGPQGGIQPAMVRRKGRRGEPRPTRPPGRRKPDGTARVVLVLIAKDPGIVQRVLG